MSQEEETDTVFKRLFQRYQEEYDNLPASEKSESFELGSEMLLAGFIKESQFVSKVNEYLAKAKQESASAGAAGTGEALAVLWLHLAANFFQFMRKAEITFQRNPMASLLNLPDIKAEDLSPEVMDQAIAWLSSEGESFVNDFVIHAYPDFIREKVEVLHLAETGLCYYDQTDDESKLEDADEQAEQPDQPWMYECTNAAVAINRQSLEKAYFRIQVPPGALFMYSSDRPVHIPSKDCELEHMTMCSIVEGHYGVSLYTKIMDGKDSDPSRFEMMAKEGLPQIKQVFTNAKYVVGNSAKFTTEVLAAVFENGMHFVTRLTSGMELEQQLLNQAYLNQDQFEHLPDESEGPVQYKEPFGLGEDRKGKPLKAKQVVPASPPLEVFWGTGQLFDKDVVAMVVFSPTLKEAKAKPKQKAAMSELNKLTKALDKSFKSEKAAQTHVAKLQAKATYCDIIVNGYTGTTESKGKAKSSAKASAKASAKDSAKASAKTSAKASEVRIDADVYISPVKFDAAVFQECCYVLVTSDTQRQWTPQELNNIYKQSMGLVTMWRTTHDADVKLNRWFLKDYQHRMGMAFLLHLGDVSRKIVQGMIRTAIAEGFIKFPDAEFKYCDPKPSIARLCFFFEMNGATISYNPHIEDKQVEVQAHKRIIVDLLGILGEEWFELLLPKTYEQEMPRLFAARPSFGLW